MRSYRSSDACVIAVRADIKIIDERWTLVTVGECDPRNRIIRVNLAALEIKCEDEWFASQMLRRLIVAHELGHFFYDEYQEIASCRERSFGEAVAHSFAVKLIGTPYSYRDYERRWRSLQGL